MRRIGMGGGGKEVWKRTRNRKLRNTNLEEEK